MFFLQTGRYLPVDWNKLVSAGLANFLGHLHHGKLPYEVETDHNQGKENCDDVRDVPRVREELGTALLLHPLQAVRIISVN